MVVINKKKSFILISIYKLIRKVFSFLYKLKWKCYYLTMADRFAYFGNNVVIDYEVTFVGEDRIYIADDVFIGSNVIVNAGKGASIKIGKGSAIGAYTTIITWNLDNLKNRGLDRSSNSNIFKEVNIGKGVGVGYGVTINPGITLGDGCEVAAGSVITRDVKPFEIVAGNPAVVIGIRSEK